MNIKSERLDSWKAIAAYLNRDESTARRWEKEGLPVHRHTHLKKASIYAYTSEIDAWWHVGGDAAQREEFARWKLADTDEYREFRDWREWREWRKKQRK
jgi:hypothetical protein